MTTTYAPASPAGGIPSGGKGLPHALALAVLGIAAVLVFFFSVLSQPYEGWSDETEYLIAGRYMVLEGRFMPEAVPYSEFVEHGAGSFGSLGRNYPNYGYSLLQGAIGLMRGSFTTMGGIWMSGMALVLAGFASYALFLALTGNRTLALVSGLVLLSHRLVVPLAGEARPDIVLLLILLLVLLCLARERHFAAGLLLGLGYLVREHALMFLPFLPLLSPQGGSVRGYLRAGAGLVLGFLPALGAAYGLKLLFSVGEQQQNFYIKNHTQWLGALTDSDFAVRVVKHIRSHIGRLGPVAWVALGFVALGYRRVPPLVRRMVLLALIFSIIPCIMWGTRPHVPNRYAVYSVPLYIAAFALCVREYRRGALFIALLALPGVALFAYKTVDAEGTLSALASPARTLEAVQRTVEAPFFLRQHFSPGSVLLVNKPAVAMMGMETAALVRLPSYKDFLQAPGNERVDGIFLKDSDTGWPEVEEFSDSHGVRFTRVEVPKEFLPTVFLCYKRAGS